MNGGKRTDAERVEVFISVFPINGAIDDVANLQRREEIFGCKNADVARAKYYVWKLLDYALNARFDCRTDDLHIYKNSCGKWVCSDVCFSLSHSGNVVAVAVGKKPLGVDVELFDRDRFGKRLAERILTSAEIKQYHCADDKPKFLAETWTKKESLFKCSDKEKFKANGINTAVGSAVSRTFEICGREYVCSLACVGSEIDVVWHVLYNSEFLDC